MKLITEHAGDILAVIVGVALLIGVVWALKNPVNQFFSGMVDSLKTLGNNVIDNVSPTAPAGLASGIAGILGH